MGTENISVHVVQPNTFFEPIVKERREARPGRDHIAVSLALVCPKCRETKILDQDELNEMQVKSISIDGRPYLMGRAVYACENNSGGSLFGITSCDVYMVPLMPEGSPEEVDEDDE